MSKNYAAQPFFGPSHWKKIKIRFIADLNPSKREINSKSFETKVSFIPMDAIGEDGTLRIDQKKTINEVLSGYTYFSEDDVTIAKITPCFENGKGAVMRGLQNGIGFGSTELIVVRPRKEHVVSDYLYWVFASQVFRSLGEAAMYGAGGQKRVSDDFVKNTEIYLPPVSEQKAIVHFLNVEIGKLKNLVDQQHLLIDLLKEKRQAIISHAVTKGLDLNVPMKDSEIQWLGCIPNHWKLEKIGHFTKTIGGGTPSRDVLEYWGGDISWVTPKDMKSEVIEGSEETLTEAGLLNSTANLIEIEHVLIVMRSGILRHTLPVGINIVPTTVNQDIKAIDVSKLMYPEFMMRLIQGLNRELLLLWSKQGATVESLETELINKTLVPVPPKSEQLEIIIHLNNKLSQYDKLILQSEQAVTLLKERREALISAAVTGKIDVRHLVQKEDPDHA
ncbi:restriction endonuclease subunit S [Paenibacillus timonensis]|nr:restriction endonuclease subunit S [Paenibacillus timonensis]MUG84805.1 restriction endonuclease subunit S [Paenibacillus timonensis]